MLLTPLDNDGVWLRYHTLLAEYLRQRLEADRVLKSVSCMDAAFVCLRELWTEAVQHAIAAGDPIERSVG
jgi:LuxR family maltose regulon positive regulatory protein